MVTKESKINEKIDFIINGIMSSSTESTFILNLINLINPINLSDTVFKQDNIIFKDLEEYSDIKTELRESLSSVKLSIASYYLATLLSCRDIRSLGNTKVIDIPKMYKLLLVNLGMFSLNTILNNYISKLDVSNVQPVDDAIYLMKYIVRPITVLDGALLNLFSKE